METLMEKFENLWMSQKISFVQYCLGIELTNPEPCVVALYEEYKWLPTQEQKKTRDTVYDWMKALTFEEMFIGVCEERRSRRMAEKLKAKCSK